MASSEVSINQLPVTSQIVNGDFLIIQTINATQRLDFENFVVGLDNTTFKDTVENNSSGVTTLSSTLYNGVTAQPQHGVVDPGDVADYVGVTSKGALTGVFSIPLQIKDAAGGSHTFNILLSSSGYTGVI